MSNEITKGEMNAILDQKIIAYKQAYYSHMVDAQIGDDLDDQKMIEAAKANMKRVQRAIDSVNKMIAEIEDS